MLPLLPDGQFDVVLLPGILGLPYRDVAGMLATTVNAVRVRWHEAIMGRGEHNEA